MPTYPRAKVLAALVVILLIGVALRLNGLGAMLNMAHYDEAYYGIDALSLLAQPRLTPFFPANFGRESLWMYLLAPSLAVFGAGAFGLRIVAVFTGVLTLAAVYRLARELIGVRGALWAAAALAVLFWHVLASHEAFRALLFPLVGALAFAFLWQAHRTNRMRLWVVGGALLGLTFYTYLAARAWLVLALLTLVVWLARGRRRGAITAALIAGVICLPLLIYLLTDPAGSLRVVQVAVSDPGALLANVAAWAGAFFAQGSPDIIYNLPGRPLLDLPLMLLFAAGLVSLLFIRRDRAVWLVLLIGASLAPALLTTEPLRWLRAIGLIVPLAILLGLGAGGVTRAAGQVIRRLDARSGAARWAASLLVIVLLVGAGGDTLRDFNQWVSSPDLFMPMEQHLYLGIDWLAEHAPPDAPVYFSPFSLDHPVLRLREWRLGARPVGAFLPAECLVLNDQPAYYLTIPVFTPDFAEQLGAYASVEAVKADDPHYVIYRAEPRASLPDDWTVIGGRIAAESIAALPTATRSGDTIRLTMAFRRVGVVDRAYTMFAHLYGVDEQNEIMLIGQDDQPICPGYPPALWRDGEAIIQRFTIPVATELGGDFTIGIGIYDSITQERLPISDETTVQPIHSLRIN